MGENKMALWDKVCTTDPKNTKSFKGKGGFRGTAICAQSQRKKATEMFGPFGIGWKVKGSVLEVVSLSDDPHHSILRYSGLLVYQWGNDTGEVELNSSIDLWEYSIKYKNWSKNNDPYKKVATDAMTKGLSELGFNSDVFEGKFDDNKYVKELKANGTPEPEVDKEKMGNDLDEAMSKPRAKKKVSEKKEEEGRTPVQHLASIQAHYGLYEEAYPDKVREMFVSLTEFEITSGKNKGNLVGRLETLDELDAYITKRGGMSNLEDKGATRLKILCQKIEKAWEDVLEGESGA